MKCSKRLICKPIITLMKTLIKIIIISFCRTNMLSCRYNRNRCKSKTKEALPRRRSSIQNNNLEITMNSEQMIIKIREKWSIRSSKSSQGSHHRRTCNRDSRGLIQQRRRSTPRSQTHIRSITRVQEELSKWTTLVIKCTAGIIFIIQWPRRAIKLKISNSVLIKKIKKIKIEWLKWVQILLQFKKGQLPLKMLIKFKF